MASTSERTSNTASTPTRLVLRPVAPPAALGFLALGGGSLVLSGLELGWYAPMESTVVGLVVLLFTFPAQLIASIFGFLARDIVVATAMGLLAGTWLTTGVVKLLSTPDSLSLAHGTVLVFVGVALLIPALTATLGELVPGLVMILAAIRFVLAGLYELTANEAVHLSAGFVGLVLVVVALYAAVVVVVREFRNTSAVPLGGAGGQVRSSTEQSRTERGSESDEQRSAEEKT